MRLWIVKSNYRYWIDLSESNQKFLFISSPQGCYIALYKGWEWEERDATFSNGTILDWPMNKAIVFIYLFILFRAFISIACARRAGKRVQSDIIIRLVPTWCVWAVPGWVGVLSAAVNPYFPDGHATAMMKSHHLTMSPLEDGGVMSSIHPGTPTSYEYIYIYVPIRWTGTSWTDCCCGLFLRGET